MKKRNSKFAKVFALILCTLMLFTACGQGATPATSPSTGSNAASGDPIKVGLITPITGAIAATGTAIRDAAYIYRDYINANGGINGRPIELIVEDSANDPTMASSAMNKLVTQDGVLCVIGSWGSSPTLASIPIARENEVPIVVETASNWKVTDKNEEGGPWVFRLSAPSMMEIAVMEDLLLDVMDFQHPYMISSNNDWGHGNTEEFQHLYNEIYQKPLAGADFIEGTDTDFSTILAKVDASGADSIIFTGDAAQCALVVEQAHNLGLDVRCLGLGMACSLYKIRKLAGDTAAEGFYQTVSYVGNIDASKSANPEHAAYLAEQWAAKNYEMMEIQEGARGFGALNVVCEALKLIDGEITRASIRDALEQVECDDANYGHVKFTEWGNFINQNVCPVAIIGVKDGKDIVLQPPTPPVFKE